MNQNASLIRISELAFGWVASEPPLISIPHFEVSRGEKLFVKGPSGSGKTTLLALLGGVVKPRSGSVEINGVDLSRLGSSQRDEFRANHIGFIFQMFNLLPYLSVLENTLLGCQFSSLRRSRIEKNKGSLKEEAERLLIALGMDSSLWKKPVTQLSVGQQQRVAASRALLGSPELLIADEPTSALDEAHRTQFIELLFKECEASNSTLVFVSHESSLAPLFDRTLSIESFLKKETS